MRENTRAVPALITQLYSIVRSLNTLFPDRPFTPDGHLVGSIGEVVASDIYDLKLEKSSTPGFDAKTKSGKTVQIKLTGGMSVSLASDVKPPDLLIVLKLDSRSGFTEIYNGEYPALLCEKKKISTRNVVSLRLNELKKLKPSNVLEAKHSLDELNRLFSAG